MVKLTRLNNTPIAVNPDIVRFADATPDTTLSLANGDRIVVRESLDELIREFVDYRRRVAASARRPRARRRVPLTPGS
ncbi:MAG: flagellar FlbD family protein [Myxococcales bacterium]|nr:flagellar FlbD family protein [Myxococcales bacterium]